MDDQTLAAQRDKTGDIMDLARDEAWVRESARLEDECGGRIEAGLAMKAYAAAKYDPALADVRKDLRRKMRLQSILFVELNRWMQEWEIGAAFEATYTEARQLVRAHLKQPSPKLADWIEAVLEEDQQPEDTDKPVRSQARAQLVLMMTDEDWKTLAQVAAAAAEEIVLSRMRTAGKTEQQTTVAA